MDLFMLPLTAVTFAFGGLLFGGIVGFITKQLIEEKMYGLYAFCGGALISLLCLELIPETFSAYHSAGPGLGITFGLLFMMLIDTYFHSSTAERRSLQAFQAFLFLALAICIHNIPTGIALGSSMVTNEETSSSLLLAVVFHHIPEGLALIIPFLFTPSKLTSFLLTILILSFVLGMGVFIGGAIQTKANHLQGIIMGSAVGTLSYVAIHEMLWKAKQKLFFLPFLLYSSAGAIIVKLYFDLFMHHH